MVIKDKTAAKQSHSRLVSKTGHSIGKGIEILRVFWLRVAVLSLILARVSLVAWSGLLLRLGQAFVSQLSSIEKVSLARIVFLVRFAFDGKTRL